MHDVATYVLIFFASGLKFIFGPTLGLAADLNWIITSLCTGAGMMLSVFSFTYFGERLKSYYFQYFGKPKKKVFSKRNRQFVRIWNKYGLVGVSMLTPIIFTPIGGTLLAVALGGKHVDIFKYMAISAFFWAFLITAALKFVIAPISGELFGLVLVFQDVNV